MVLAEELGRLALVWVAEVELEVVLEVVLEVEPGLALELAPEVVPELAPEMEPELAPELAPEVELELAPEVEQHMCHNDEKRDICRTPPPTSTNSRHECVCWFATLPHIQEWNHTTPHNDEQKDSDELCPDHQLVYHHAHCNTLVLKVCGMLTLEPNPEIQPR